MRILYFPQIQKKLSLLITVIFLLMMVLLVLSEKAFSQSMAVNGTNVNHVIEHLRLKVSSDSQSAWLKAEKGSWGPWLDKQKGFLGRQLLWDEQRQEAILLITWESRDLWKAIPKLELDLVQEKFERIAREETGQKSGNPFPLEFEGELLPQ